MFPSKAMEGKKGVPQSQTTFFFLFFYLMTDRLVSLLFDIHNEKIYASISRSFELNSLYSFISPQAESTHLYLTFFL
jgi:hypothetical protein